MGLVGSGSKARPGWGVQSQMSGSTCRKALRALCLARARPVQRAQHSRRRGVHLGCWAMSGQAAPLRPGCTGLGAWACSFGGYSQAAGPKYGLTEVWAERSKASRLV